MSGTIAPLRIYGTPAPIVDVFRRILIGVFRDPNRYCWVFVMRGGKVAEITEYTDTQLIAEILAPPPAALSPRCPR
ncbi:nuclear transport factor 2 family protein [Microbispora rosea]|uniref:nuclear transport factor 2 family protein n=1 Tax=Microbispora rosea TaxID=58117 RepID=UPI00344499B1